MEPVVTAVRYYEQFQEMPKCIVVGVFDEKLEDVAVIDEVGRPMNESARYFEFISNELVPYIQGKYPIANFKGIVASEEAGFLINYYLLSPKSPFSMYVSLNPTVIPRMAPEFATGSWLQDPQKSTPLVLLYGNRRCREQTQLRQSY